MTTEQEKIGLWKCTKCQHVWVNRKLVKPTLCPKCRAYKYIEPLKTN